MPTSLPPETEPVERPEETFRPPLGLKLLLFFVALLVTVIFLEGVARFFR